MRLSLIASLLLLSSTATLAAGEQSRSNDRIDLGQERHKTGRLEEKAGPERPSRVRQRKEATTTNELPSNDNRRDWFTTVSLSGGSNGAESLSGSTFSSSSSQSSGSSSWSSGNWSSSSSSSSSAVAITSRMGCSSGQRKIKFSITVDKYGSETTWNIQQLSTNQIVMSNSRTYSPYDTESVEQCVDAGYPEEQYQLTLYDEVGDGICCKSGNGGYTLFIEESGSFTPLVTGGNFKKTKMTHLISVRSKEPPLSSRDEEWLTAHNTRRKYWHNYYQKSYVPLKWSGELAASSQLYAEKLLATCGDQGIEHDPNNMYGENMAKNKGMGTWGSLYAADKIVGRFVDREVDIGYPHNYHLTQALWRATRYVGCGESEMDWNGGICRIQVCRYSKVS
ncbi:hypothetical protein HJC23_009737 [Cyclotella cryptica]|uniref:SCP domain-containing protein n=1 Tax=Cyclotella cryptica TaxID=29204 RepID=A0ABD3PQM1_9STRA|eukprot:CCRYP_012878-RA/>CCRYP_012878-RA protein AED:0.02 eAED:0.02 QI:452/1/1/1/1/1/2/394/392